MLLLGEDTTDQVDSDLWDVLALALELGLLLRCGLRMSDGYDRWPADLWLGRS